MTSSIISPTHIGLGRQLRKRDLGPIIGLGTLHNQRLQPLPQKAPGLSKQAGLYTGVFTAHFRIQTAEEAARLQNFCDDYRFFARRIKDFLRRSLS